MKPYRLKQKKTGLYYADGTLAEWGKVYRHSNNYFTYLGNGAATLRIKYGSAVHLAHKEILEELDKLKEKRKKMFGQAPIFISVTADDFEKEYFEPKEIKRR